MPRISEKGQGVVEFVLIFVLTLIVAVAAYTILGEALRDKPAINIPEIRSLEFNETGNPTLTDFNVTDFNLDHNDYASDSPELWIIDAGKCIEVFTSPGTKQIFVATTDEWSSKVRVQTPPLPGGAINICAPTGDERGFVLVWVK